MRQLRREVDIVVGAGGQDGRLLLRRLTRMGRNVIALTAGDSIYAHEKILWLNSSSENILEVGILLSDESISVGTIYYFAAVHNTSSLLSDLNEKQVKYVLYDLPIYLIQKTYNCNGLRHFVYASSKLVFQADNTYSFKNKRSTCNPYAKWKNRFEEYFDSIATLEFKKTLLWFSNHDSILRKNNFLLPRLAAHVVNVRSKDLLIKDFGDLDFYNDWGCAVEFMHNVIAYVEKDSDCNLKIVHKQFVTNNNAVSLNDFFENWDFENVKLKSRKMPNFFKTKSIIYENPLFRGGSIPFGKVSSYDVFLKIIRYHKMIKSTW